jgi:hypothetical protein
MTGQRNLLKLYESKMEGCEERTLTINGISMTLSERQYGCKELSYESVSVGKVSILYNAEGSPVSVLCNGETTNVANALRTVEAICVMELTCTMPLAC